ncbi:MAG: MTH1187 family thiamine-binding protein [Aquificaceae bacterium]
MSVLVFFSMTPIGKGESVSEFVARVVDLIDKSGFEYVLTPMGTIFEAPDIDSAMKLLSEGLKRLQIDCNRVSITAKIDYRNAPMGRLKSKVSSVKEHLGREISST